MVQIFYWILLFLMILFGGYNVFRPNPDNRFYYGGNALFLFVMFLLIGIALFGFPLEGRAPVVPR